jgi:hypothetical protein
VDCALLAIPGETVGAQCVNSNGTITITTLAPAQIGDVLHVWSISSINPHLLHRRILPISLTAVCT